MNRSVARSVSFRALRRCAAGWMRASAISSNQRKQIIVTAAAQVNPTNPQKPAQIHEKTAKTIHAPTAVRLILRTTPAAAF
jgi:hypothetical protein